MKKILILAVMAASVTAVFQSCSKGGSGGGDNSNATLTVTMNKTSIRADDFEEITFTVKDKNGADVTSSSSLIISNRTYLTNVYTAAAPGTYKVKARKGSEESAEVSFTATDPGPSPFTQKLLVEDFTGTWCGHCPRVGVNLDNYAATRPNCYVIGIHGPAGSGDPYVFQYDQQLRNAFAVNGWPTVVVNRDYKWNEANSALDNEAAKRAPLGLALETTVNGTNVDVKAKVKFDVTTTIPMKLVVYLVESNLVYSQVNYGYHGLPDPIANYNHKNVARRVGTDVFGDDIPAGSQVKNSIWEKNMTINASGFNLANCKVIAFVMYGAGGTNRKGVLNVQGVTVGQTKNFD